MDVWVLTRETGQYHTATEVLAIASSVERAKELADEWAECLREAADDEPQEYPLDTTEFAWQPEPYRPENWCFSPSRYDRWVISPIELDVLPG